MIHWIAASDRRLDPYRRVGDPRWLRQQDLFVAEGRLVVERLLDLGRYDVGSILVNRAAHDALLDRLARAESSVYVCDDPTLASVTGFNFHRGCLALVRRPAPLPPDHLMSGTTLLALEGVGNPDNVGGLFRTAAAFGVDGVLLDSTSGDPFYRKAVRTSMGAVLRLPFARLEAWSVGLEAFRSRGFTVAALTPRPDARQLSEFAAALPAGARVLIVAGAEGPGLGDATLACADARVRIPIDSAIDSLNVVVAAGIAIERIRSR
ncbi:MAG: TrmH family RNA methyltransferase [Burkholderiales bacterium]